MGFVLPGYVSARTVPPSGGSLYTATHYASPTGTASWAEATSISTPCSLDTALTNAVAGNQVQCEGGVYQRTTTDDRWLLAYAPANAGTSGNEIVFFAANRAIDTVITSQRAKLTTDATTGSANGCPLIGGNTGDNYIIWDGFWIDEIEAVPTPDTGPVVLTGGCTGVKVLGCITDGMDVTGFDGWAVSTAENHNGIRIENAVNCTIADNQINDITNPAGSHNGAGIMMYGGASGSNGHIIENNEIDGCGCGMYIKGQNPGVIQDLIVRRNLVTNAANAGIEFGWHTGTASYVYQNIVIGCGHGIMLGRDGIDNVKVYNNTLVSNTYNVYLKTGISSHTGNEVRNNISITPTVSHLTGDIGGAITADIAPDYNCYDTSINHWYINSTTYTSFSSYDAGSGVYEDNSMQADPVIVGGGDYSLDTGSPCIGAALDVLDILGGGTSAAINMGAHVNSDTIGVRLAV